MSLQRALGFCLTVLALFGAGCLPEPPKPPANAPFLPIAEAPKTDTPALPCLSFEKREGLASWLTAYAAGQTDAVNLATRARLPAAADPKLIQDMQDSLTDGAQPSFVCVLDDKGQKISWVMERPESDTDACRDTFYVSINGEGTVSDLTVDGRSSDCHQLCIPKRQETGMLVWQCDMQTDGDRKAWSQLNMNRDTGTAEIVKCQKDNIGMPAGCVE